jgi:glycosyltransferase involved in cell wall biosynthesis
MGFLGRFMDQKGFEPLLHALRLARPDCPPFRLVAVGSGDYQREYARLAERLGLSDCVTFLPQRPNIAPLLKQLDLMVMPSLWESCGLLAMEAMVAGVPVLGSDCIGLREVLRDTPAVVAPAGDVPALAKAIADCIRSPRTAEARAFAPVARERFRAERAAEALMGVFEDVLTRRAS